MSLASGTRIGPYVVHSPIGAGGMGEVYRARDTKLNRDVALKILPPLFAQDRERLARFQREAQLLAQLNHTHIAQVHGLEESDGTPALVMELVEGPTLEEKLAAGPAGATRPLPIDEALAIARQVADALEAAHEQGIIHRDLKPANVKVRADGTVKVLDFGLAKAFDTSTAARDLSATNPPNSPTITTPAMTTHGMILGTAAYMSPEQARGRTVDKRADIWAFGCVLFEMLTARRPFDGDTVTDTLAAVVMREPDWQALPTDTPAHVRHVLARCLAKDPRQRLRDIGDVRLELDSPAADVALESTAAQRVKPGWLRYVPWIVATASLAAAATVVLRPGLLRQNPDAARAIRFTIQPPDGGGLDLPGTIRSAGAVTISPDGRRLSFLATVPGGRIWIRDLASTEPTLIKGSEGGHQPFWSADGRTLGFFAGSGLKKVDLESGAVQDIGLASVNLGAGARGATMNQDGTILFKDDTHRVIQRIMPGASAAQPLTEVNAARGDRNHSWPYFLPDGRQFLFHATTAEDATTGVYLGSLDSSETRFVAQADSNMAFAQGHVLFMRGGVLLAQPFDAAHGVATGPPVAIVQRVVYSQTNRRGEFAVSNTGILAYASGGVNLVRLAWFDRSGNKVGEVDGSGHMDISLDDRRVVADRIDPQTGARDVWVFDYARGQRTRLSFSPVNDWVPVFSPDGTTVVYTSEKDSPGVAQLYQKASNGSGAETLLLKTNAGKHHMDWSPDGRFLAFEENAADGMPDLWMLPMTGERKPALYLQGPFREAQPSFSPDSRFLGYTSNESGIFEVYVQTFPMSGGKWQISTNGGTNPQWRRDRKEMYYLAADGKIMAVDVDLKAPSFGVPRPLFQTSVAGDTTTDHYAVTSDGQRFLIQDNAPATRTGFTVVLNWLAELRK